jgi:hypothetical protein
METEDVYSTVDNILSRILVLENYAKMLPSVVNLDISPSRIIFCSLVSYIMLEHDFYSFPLSLITAVQDMLEDLDESSIPFLLTIGRTVVEGNPNVVIYSPYEDNFDPRTQFVNKMAVASEGVNLGVSCPLEPFHTGSVDPCFELKDGITMDGGAYAPNDHPRFVNGQLKLFTALTNFLVDYSYIRHLVYVGASPGINIASIAVAFPHVSFYLNDIVPIYYEGLYNCPNVSFFSSIDQMEGVLLDWSTVAYYSDVYAGLFGTEALLFQMDQVSLFDSFFRPAVCSFKRNLDWGQSTVVKLKGSKLMTEVHLTSGSGELREVLEFHDCVFSYEFETLSILKLESMLMYYNNTVRSSSSQVLSPLTDCNHYDCHISGSAYALALSLCPPASAREFFMHVKAMFDSDLKLTLCVNKDRYISHNVVYDQLGYPVDLTKDGVFPEQITSHGHSRITNRVEQMDYYVPPYKHYTQTNTLTTNYNFVLYRYDLRLLDLRGFSCHKHSIPASFPTMVLLDYCCRNQLPIKHTCGCVYSYSVGDCVSYTEDEFG